MKAIMPAALLIFIIGNIGAVDIESYQFIDYLRAIPAPGKPQIYEDEVIFTFPSSYNRVGISFAHEGYAKVYWFKRFMIPKDHSELFVHGKFQSSIDPNRDSGIMFHHQVIPENKKNMDYRMIIDGLWTTDPLNPLTITGPSGIAESRVPLPERPKYTPSQVPQPGTYRFLYRAEPGEIITVGGNFNNWDPFMYVLEELSPGFYTLTLSLPPGSFHYAYYHRGELVPDQTAKRLFTREGRIISEGIVP